MKMIEIADRLIEGFGRKMTGGDDRLTEPPTPMNTVHDRCSRCGLRMPTNVADLCMCWNKQEGSGRYWEGRWRDEAKENEALRGHKEEADRHIKTIAQLRDDVARMAASFVHNQNVIKAAVAAERERCAQVAVGFPVPFAKVIAAAIRKSEQ